MFATPSPSSSQASQGSQGFGASITGTLRYIGETIAQYTGLGSQTPPASQAEQPEPLPEADDEVMLLPTPELNLHSRSLRAGAVSVQPATGLKVRDYAYKNPLPPLKRCSCCEPQALLARMARASPSNIPAPAPASPASPSSSSAVRSARAPVASSSRVQLRPLKRSGYYRAGGILGFNTLDYVPPECVIPRPPKSSQSQQSTSEEERQAKRQKTSQPEFVFRLTKTPSPRQSPGSPRASKLAPRTPPRNRSAWIGAGPRTLFTPTASPVANHQEELPPTPPTVPADLPHGGDSFLESSQLTEEQDMPMEGVVSTAPLTSQGSEHFSEWCGISRSSSLSESFQPSKLSPQSSLEDASKITDSPRRLKSLSSSESEESLGSASTSMSGATLVDNDPPQAGPSTSYQLRPRPPNSTASPAAAAATTVGVAAAGLTSPRSPSRVAKTSVPPRRTSTAAPRFARRRDVSPTLSLTLTRQSSPATSSTATSTRKDNNEPYPQAAPHTRTRTPTRKPLLTKTRSTMSRRASEQTMSVIKPAVRRSPRTKKNAAVVVRGARGVLARACVIVPTRAQAVVRGGRARERERVGGMRGRVRC